MTGTEFALYVELIWSLLDMLEFGIPLSEIGICELKDAWL